jgi:hypothetical protein
MLREESDYSLVAMNPVRQLQDIMPLVLEYEVIDVTAVTAKLLDEIA